MKAFILCAGLGTRLRPLTYTLPKPLLPVWGRANVCNVIDHLSRHGIKDVIINTHHLPEKLRQVLGKRVKYSFEKKLLDTGGGLKKVEYFLRNDTFIMYNCDVVTDVNLKDMINSHKKNRNYVTLLGSTRHEPKAMVINKKGRVIDFVSGNRGNCVFCGVHIIEPFVLDFIPKGKPVSVIDIYRKLIEEGIGINTFLLKNDPRTFHKNPTRKKVRGEFWREIGDMESYRDINEKQIF